jgi:LasA protease
LSRLDLVRKLVVATALLSLAGGCSRAGRTERVVDATATWPATMLVDGTPRAAPTAQSGMPNVGVPAQSTALPEVYTVQSGDTLVAIAARFGLDLAALVAANGIADPDSLQVGQQLKIPTSQLAAGPTDHLLPDSEFVNGPAYVGFETSAFCATQGGYLASYQEKVEGAVLTGPEIISLVARDYSVGPRLLLSVLESISGWVTNPTPSEMQYAMGDRRSGRESFYIQLQWAANQLNQGYYDWRGRGMTPINWGDGTRTGYSPSLNAATAGLQYFYSLVLGKNEWAAAVSRNGLFVSTYRRLFGDPSALAVEPLIPAGTQQPKLTLPWSADEMWWFTSGPHGGWGEGSAWASVDFVPDEGYLGCQMAASWATAAAAGLVIQSAEGQVKIDLDGDGREETGWVLFYLHVASDGRVPVLAEVRQGDRIGHPSCEGGVGNSTHLHFARKCNGEWIAADGPLPMILDGWQFHSAGNSYDGTATRDDQEREACECQTQEVNGLSARR